MKLRREQKKIEASKLLLANGYELPKASKKGRTNLNLPDEEGDDTGDSANEEEEVQPVKVKKTVVQQKKPTTKTKVQEDVEEEIVYIKKAKAKVAPKKKKKKIIVYQDASSDSESDSDSDSDSLPPAHHFKSQRNKKSMVKVYDTPLKRQPEQQEINYFCD